MISAIHGAAVAVPTRARRALVGVCLAGAAVLGTGPAAGAGSPAPAAAALAASTDGPLTGANPAGCVDDWQGEPLFADQFKVQHATAYALTYGDNYKLLTVGTGDAAQDYVLVQCGTTTPELIDELADAVVVEIPVSTIFASSSSHLGFLDELGLADRLAGFGQPDAVVLPSIRERIDAGEVVGFAPNYEIDTEAVLAAAPDVFIGGGFPDPAFPTLTDAGIAIVDNADWLETSPKGWAEWVGFFAALTNTEAQASTLYETWVTEYDDAATLAATAADRPTVIDGSMFQGTWYMAAGNSIRATFINDAGGDYLFGDNADTGTLTSDIETMLAEGADADVWVGVSDFFTTKSEAIAIDERYGAFAAWDGLGVFSTSGNPTPGLLFAESGPTMIGPYLRDFVKAIHPELAADHEFVFLTQIPNE